MGIRDMNPAVNCNEFQNVEDTDLWDISFDLFIMSEDTDLMKRIFLRT